MEPWKKVCIYVSIYAILREFRPIDPFVIKYLTLLPEKYTIQIVSLLNLIPNICIKKRKIHFYMIHFLVLF